MSPRPRPAPGLPLRARLFGFCLAWALWTPLAPGAPSDPPLTPPLTTPATPSDSTASDPTETAPTDPEEALRRALDLERLRQWPAAIEAYEEALKVWPGRAEFRHRLRLCESHYRLGRRYQDQSFRGVLLRLDRRQALELYDEVLERIQSHYVDPVSLVPLLRRGLDNMEVALRDPNFLRTNAPSSDPSRVQQLRQALAARRNQIAARDRDDAVAFVAAVGDLARQSLGVPASAVILEFAYGACEALPDDYSACLTPDKLDDLFAIIDGNFVGLGVELKSDPKGLKLVGVIPGGPAAEGGLKLNERITQIGGRSIAGMGLDEAAALLQGPEGSSLDLVLLDPQDRTRSVRLVRREVEVRSVSQAKLVDPIAGVGYIRLDGFQKTSTDEIRGAVSALQSRGMRFLVLDLRGNPGGLLDVAVDIADEFLDSGVIVSTRGRANNQSAVYRARNGSVWRGTMAVLVDHDSASASEILAGALKDNRRAVVLGERSFGKGSVQSIFPLRVAPAGLKLTTAKFYSPRDQSYSEHGVEPDVTIHTVARPAGDGPVDPIEPSFGDPERDPALERAIAVARRQPEAPR